MNLVLESGKLLEIPVQLEEAIREEVSSGNLVQEHIEGRDCLFLTPLHRAEVGTAASIGGFQQDSRRGVPSMHDKAIPWVEKKTGLILSASQHEAVRLALPQGADHYRWPRCGQDHPGQQHSPDHSGQTDLRVTLCAPTGRAAKRLSESTGSRPRLFTDLLEFDPQSFGFKRGKTIPWKPICLLSTNLHGRYRPDEQTTGSRP